MKEKYVEDLLEGEEIEDDFAVREKEPPREYTKGWFFKLKVGDKTGDIPLVYWGTPDKKNIEKKYEQIQVGNVLKVKGAVSRYKGDLQIYINKDDFHSLTELDEEAYRVEEFLRQTKKDVDEMFEELKDISEGISDENLKELIDTFLKDEEFVPKFKKTPYSKRYNNNYIGGLLEHVLNDTKMAERVAEIYPDLNSDLLISGAILHDLGKVEEYESTTSIELTSESRMIGHTVLCERMVRERMQEMPGFPEDLSLKLSHIILSHHGDYEWGSARSPRLEEAVALHHIDLMDVRLSGFLQAKEDLPDEDEEMIYVSKEGVQRPIFTD